MCNSGILTQKILKNLLRKSDHFVESHDQNFNLIQLKKRNPRFSMCSQSFGSPAQSTQIPQFINECCSLYFDSYGTQKMA